MRHRDVEILSASVVEDAIRRTPYEHHVMWTGDSPSIKQGSLRARTFDCIREAGIPVRLREIMQRAARLDGDLGLHPDLVRATIRLHQASRPCVYLLLDRRASGDYVAVTDIPCAGQHRNRVVEGEVVFNPRGSSGVLAALAAG